MEYFQLQVQPKNLKKNTKLKFLEISPQNFPI